MAENLSQEKGQPGKVTSFNLEATNSTAAAPHRSRNRSRSHSKGRSRSRGRSHSGNHKHPRGRSHSVSRINNRRLDEDIAASKSGVLKHWHDDNVGHTPMPVRSVPAHRPSLLKPSPAMLHRIIMASKPKKHTTAPFRVRQWNCRGYRRKRGELTQFIATQPHPPDQCLPSSLGVPNRISERPPASPRHGPSSINSFNGT
ncbi:hypothetical protein HPB50_019029 [Hyalomma asiaticum]|uniref:Uncharacterized protein n=1 Tax=Hyalomma asiaticum TaxID=266040 RepID=A0ACB7TKK8_HYAAI|nr:hypothetical protein HPB50_019029 [Hyalomma asiaticum]